MTNKPPTLCSLSTLRVSIADMISLNVRTPSSKNPELPEFLFQEVPDRAMTVMSTIPSGTPAVSLPGADGSNCGYPILKIMPPSSDGFVVVYERKPNGRYEAVTVRYQAKMHEIAEFIRFARQHVEQKAGRLKAIPGRYAHFAPGLEEWGFILRDGGYVAWDPSNLPSTVSREMLESLQMRQSSGIIARIPVYSGEKQVHGEVLPVFAQVEVMLNPECGLQGDWVDFAEYAQIRADRSRLPESMIADFHEWLRLLTDECGFQYWIFRLGMLFGDRVEWWRGRCRRRTEHEGVDFAEGWRTGSGNGRIPEGAPVRSMAAGQVVAILDDFIGKTVVVRHPAVQRPDGGVFHTLLSHIQPRIRLLDNVAQGQIVGTVGTSTNTGAPAHLHLTGAWIPKSLPSGGIRMDHIHPAFTPVVLANFRDSLNGNPLCSFETGEGASELHSRPQNPAEARFRK